MSVRRLHMLAMLAGLSAASFAYAESGTPAENARLFASIEMPSLDAILHTQASDEEKYQDQLIMARGAFAVKDREKILAALRDYGFQVGNDMAFATGDDNDWWKLDGEAGNEIKLRRSKPGEDETFKLFEMKDGRGVFLFELAEF